MSSEYVPSGEAVPPAPATPAQPTIETPVTSAPSAEYEPLAVPNVPAPYREPAPDPRLAELNRQHLELVKALEELKKPAAEEFGVEEEPATKQNKQQMKEISGRIASVEKMLLDQRRQNEQFGRATRIDTAIGQTAQILDQLCASAPLTNKGTDSAKKVASKIKRTIMAGISEAIRANPDNHGLTSAHVEAAFAREYNEYLDLVKTMPNVRAAEVAAQVQANNASMPAPSGGSSPQPGQKTQQSFRPGTEEFRQQQAQKARDVLQSRINARQNA